MFSLRKGREVWGPVSYLRRGRKQIGEGFPNSRFSPMVSNPIGTCGESGRVDQCLAIDYVPSLAFFDCHVLLG